MAKQKPKEKYAIILQHGGLFYKEYYWVKGKARTSDIRKASKVDSYDEAKRLCYVWKLDLDSIKKTK
jgi:hypothetical protein